MIIFYDLFFITHTTSNTQFSTWHLWGSCFWRKKKKDKVPESSSSSQGISLKGGAVSVGNDVASDLRYGTTCLFQASDLLLYFFKNFRSEVLHFQLPLTQIYYLLVVLQTKFLLQWFSQNHVYLWLHCNSCLCLGCIPHSSVYFLSF